MRESNESKGNDQLCLFPDSQSQSANRKSILKRTIDENYLTQPLLKESDHFGSKPKRVIINRDQDLLNSMASMAFDTDDNNREPLIQYQEVPLLSQAGTPSTQEFSSRLTSRKQSVKVREEKSPQKTKLLTKIEMKLTNVPKEEFLRKKDVTLEEKRVLMVYTKLNVAAFLVQVFVLLILLYFFKGFQFLDLKKSQITVTRNIILVQLGIIVLLEIFFIILPLPYFKCFGSRQHINNILMLKIKWFFMIQCFIQTVAVLSFTTLSQKYVEYVPISTIVFILFKFYVHYFGYRRIKYLDDGRDYVSIKEFFSVHVTFSVLNSWVSYFAIYNLDVYLRDYIIRFQNNTPKIQETLSIIALILMMFETTVHLAYYKDIIFAIITLLNYIGMVMYNNEQTLDKELNQVMNLQKALIGLTALFILVTLLHDFDKVFYRQYLKFYFKYQQNRIKMLNTPKKDKLKLYQMRSESAGRSQSFVVWQQFYDLQQGNKQYAHNNHEEDQKEQERLLKEKLQGEKEELGAQWYEDTELDRGEEELTQEDNRDLMSKLQGSVLSEKTMGRISQDFQRRSLKKSGVINPQSQSIVTQLFDNKENLKKKNQTIRMPKNMSLGQGSNRLSGNSKVRFDDEPQ